MSGKKSIGKYGMVPRVKLTGKSLIENRQVLEEKERKSKVVYAHNIDWKSTSMFERKRAWASTSSSSGADEMEEKLTSSKDLRSTSTTKDKSSKPSKKRHQHAQNKSNTTQ